MLLAASVPATPRDQVLEIGTGTGAAALCLARRVKGVRVTGLELQRDLVRIAGENAALNGLEAEVAIVFGDLLNPAHRAWHPAASTMSWPTRPIWRPAPRPLPEDGPRRTAVGEGRGRPQGLGPLRALDGAAQGHDHLHPTAPTGSTGC